ncbi:hypothetical protein RSOL_513130 [Rhizoctonia solani AG-3 Rhs1AP]|uniref:Uncharacterized protein n=1 Tax=Rhizoctonia solani AG-3 Rhs1AP TaxID=1086054 RepID=X8JMP2_9AGAM|nr:hypothetical protein RSOL_513130 [Rhizoctonia solani AG-3 Rhs1AP]
MLSTDLAPDSCEFDCAGVCFPLSLLNWR